MTSFNSDTFKYVFDVKGKLGMRTCAAELRRECSIPNWDGYNGIPLFRKCYEYVLEIIEATDDDVLDFYNLFPSPNGTFLFKAKLRATASMSVGLDGFSYAAYKYNKVPIRGKEDFNAVHAAEILAKMKTYFRQ